MPRLSNRPCATCKVDTLHEGIVCKTCGAIFQMPNREAFKRAKVRDFIRRKFSPKRRAEVREREAARKAANIGPLRHVPIARGPFGGGRERTKA